MKIKLSYILIVFVAFSIQNNSYSQTRNYFAVGLITGANSSVTTYAIVSMSGNKFLGAQIIDEQFFMFYALGHWPCKANPKRENLFKKNGIENCHLLYNNSGKVNGYYLGPLEELWRIKYKSHPQKRDQSEGWSNDYYKPTSGQAKYLFKKYGVINVNTNYFIGEQLFKLLKDIQNPEWITNYSSIVN